MAQKKEFQRISYGTQFVSGGINQTLVWTK